MDFVKISLRLLASPFLNLSIMLHTLLKGGVWCLLTQSGGRSTAETTGAFGRWEAVSSSGPLTRCPCAQCGMVAGVMRLASESRKCS